MYLSGIKTHMPRLRPAAAIAISLWFVLSSGTAQAQCENSFTATSSFNQMARDIASDLNDFIEQEENFIEDKITRTAKDEVITRLEEFDKNIREGLSVWWREHFEPALKQMTTQLHVSQIDQNRVMGSMMDAQTQGEFRQDMQRREVEARRRYEPNELTCQIDTVAQGQTRAARMALASARALAKDAQPRRMAASGTPAAQGPGADQKEMWEEYTSHFCDPDKGGQGCTAAGDLAGRHVDLPRLLWADQQTLDMSSPNNLTVVNGVLKYLINPRTPVPVPEEGMESPVGQETFLKLRAQTARQNAVYNSVALMLGQRMSGSGVSTQDVRTASGLPAADASTDASYAEIMHAVTKDRFHNPQYIVRLVQSPEQVVREQGAVSSVRLQQMNDLYKRMEDMVFMEAASYAALLDKNIPKPDLTTVPVRK